jgi:hypothetical protein
MNSYLRSILESTTVSDEDQELYNTDDVYATVEEEVSLEVTPETARVIRTAQNEYCIGLDELVEVTKYLSESYSECDEYKALCKICEANGIDMDINTVAVVIPSKAQFEAFIEACAKEASGCQSEAGKCKAKNKIKNVKKKIKNLGKKVKLKKCK